MSTAGSALTGSLRGVARWLLRDVVAAELAWYLRWGIRVCVLATVLVFIVRLWLVPAAEAWAQRQRDAVVTQLRHEVTSAPAGLLDKVRNRLEGEGR